MKNMVKEIYFISPRKLRIIIEKIIKKTQKGTGEYWSILLRDIYEDIYGIKIGIGTYGCFMQEKYKYITFGNYTSIADGFEYFPRNHPKKFASLHPMFYNKKLGFIKEDKIKFNELNIGSDVWIGKNVLITSKCDYIGNGAIIGAGSVVTKNVEPYTIVAGNPATIIGKRFDERTIKELEKSLWYNLSKDELVNFLNYVCDPYLFAEKIIDYNKEKKHDY